MSTCSNLTKVPPGNQEKHVEGRGEERLQTTPVSIPLAPILAGQGAALPDTKAKVVWKWHFSTCSGLRKTAQMWTWPFIIAPIGSNLSSCEEKNKNKKGKAVAAAVGPGHTWNVHCWAPRIEDSVRFFPIFSTQLLYSNWKVTKMYPNLCKRQQSPSRFPVARSGQKFKSVLLFYYENYLFAAVTVISLGNLIWFVSWGHVSVH